MVNKSTEDKQQIVSQIMQELQKELDKPNVEVIKNRERASSNPTFNTRMETSKLFKNLSSEDKKVAKHLSDMGFSLSRVTRAIRDFKGQDKKSVVEYLLAIQFLVDSNISEDDAIKALSLTQYDKHKAKLYYESLRTLRDLGFPEDKASAALLKCNIDRDSALDILIA